MFHHWIVLNKEYYAVTKYLNRVSTPTFKHFVDQLYHFGFIIFILNNLQYFEMR